MGIQDCMHPVSYTHLDVYKRQGVSYAKTPISQEQTKERWKINSTSLLGDAATTGWNATPGTPILVGDYMYCYLDQRIWKIELATGKAVGSARVYGTSINQFFIYLAYGDGKIFMPCKANSLGDVDVSGSFILSLIHILSGLFRISISHHV